MFTSVPTQRNATLEQHLEKQRKELQALNMLMKLRFEKQLNFLKPIYAVLMVPHPNA